MAAAKRKGKNVNFDPQMVASHSYNDHAGAQKNVSVGPKLEAIKLSETSYTTDASTVRRVGFGKQLAIYNNSSTLYSVTFGDTSAVAAAASGATTATGIVSIPCKPNDWTYVASGEHDWVITNNVLLLVFIIKDHTEMNFSN